MYGFEKISPVPSFPAGEPEFVNELRKYPGRKPRWQQEKVPQDAVDLRHGWKLETRFPDPEELLKSAYDALDRFKEAYTGKSSESLKILIEKAPQLSFEEYIVNIAPRCVTIQAADTEGVRRAVYALIDRMRGSNIPALEFGTFSGKPWLKNRISRCFFGPIKRPPFFRDELTDEVDYYPDGYLDLLASEGINGIWLTVSWKELAVTGFFPEDPLRTKRIAKLKQTVEKCRKYGIKVWAFCIEPMSWHPLSNPLPENCRDMLGEPSLFGGYQAFCIGSENGRRYVRESSASIFRDVPHLGGMMLISLGERPTSCLSYIDEIENDFHPCSKKCGLNNSQILNAVLSNIKAGIRDAGSDAEVLSWLYSPRPGQIRNWWFDLPLELDEDKILAFNFESGCTKAQTGKVHAGGDYWLSAIGPSDRFGRMAAAAKGRCKFAAKLQVGCSHELATVPFMPVPGNLYQKYKAMKALGVEHVIQCWYFGNYPGIMNRAAGKLAFEQFDRDEKSFLCELARPEWGEAMAETIADMWMKFGKAYSNYPLDIQYQYYGPMHDGIVWPLHVKQVFRPLTRSWKPDNFPAGDAIGESLANHSLADSEILTGGMAAQWNEAAALIPRLREMYADDPERQRDCDLYEALQILINSGSRIMSFYHLRQMLHAGNRAVIPQMRELAELEKSASARMIALCRSDCRLGYHSEAEVYKYHPAKLQWRIGELEKTIAALDELAEKEPEEIRELVKWDGPVIRTNQKYFAETFSSSVEKVGNELHFSFEYKEISGGSAQELRQLMLMDKSGMKLPLLLLVQPGGENFGYCGSAQGAVITDLGSNKFLVRVPWGRFDYATEIFAGFQRIWFDGDNKMQCDNIPHVDTPLEMRLNFGGHSPERYALLQL